MPEPTSLGSPLGYALAYAQMGWHVLPLEPRAKHPLGRLVPRGMLDATAAPETIRQWWKAQPSAGVGIALAPSGLVAIDVDPHNGGTETFDALQAEHGSLVSNVITLTGGGSEHHVFVVPPGAQVSLPGTLGPGVDLMANGYIVVEPSVHPSGKAYGWEASSSPLVDRIAPSPLPDWLRNFRAERRPAPEAGTSPAAPAPARDPREYLIDVNSDEWIRAGMALHQAWLASVAPTEPPDEVEFTVPDGVQLRGALPLVFAEDIQAEAIHMAQIIEDVLTAQGLAVMYGEPNSGKSFMACDMACSVGAGIEWLGKRTVRGAVLYVAGEGAESVKLRLLAWRQHNACEPAPAVAVVPIAVNLLLDGADVSRLQHACEQVEAHYGMPVSLIVVDTLARAFGGGNENAPEDMGAVIANADRIRLKVNANLLFVHHSGKDAAKGSRGHSSLKGATDTEIEVTGDAESGTHTAEITKQRDLPSRGLRLSARFASVEMGRDQWGKPTTTCVVEAIDAVPRSKQAKGAAVRRALVAVLSAAPARTMGRSELAAALKSRGFSQSAAYRAIDHAVQQMAASEAMGRVYLHADQTLEEGSDG